MCPGWSAGGGGQGAEGGPFSPFPLDSTGAGSLAVRPRLLVTPMWPAGCHQRSSVGFSATLPALRWFVSTHAAGDTAFGISNSVCAALCCVQGARLDEEAQSTMRLLADIESTFCCHMLFFAFSFWSPACHPLVSLELLSLCCCPRAPFSDTCPLGALRVLFLETLPAPYSLPTPFFCPCRGAAGGHRGCHVHFCCAHRVASPAGVRVHERPAGIAHPRAMRGGSSSGVEGVLPAQAEWAVGEGGKEAAAAFLHTHQPCCNARLAAVTRRSGRGVAQQWCEHASCCCDWCQRGCVTCRPAHGALV